MSDSKGDAGTLPMDEHLAPHQLQRWHFINKTSRDDAPPAAFTYQYNYGSNDDNDEVPFSVSIVHPSNTLDFKDDDDYDKSY